MITSTENKRLRTVTVEKNTWILELPDEICESEGFARGTLASLTFRDGAILSSLITPTLEADAAAKDFIGRYGEFMKDIAAVD